MRGAFFLAIFFFRIKSGIGNFFRGIDPLFFTLFQSR